MKAGPLLRRVCQVERGTRNDMVCVPHGPIIFPGHGGDKLALQIYLKFPEVHIQQTVKNRGFDFAPQQNTKATPQRIL
jgi:hypothetical protein